MHLPLTIEIAAVLTSLAYLILLMQQKIACWFFGIVSSLLSIYLFLVTKLYSDAILYSYYVVMGIYGWYHWNRRGAKNLPLQQWPLRNHIAAILLGVAASLGLGWFFASKTDANNAFADAFNAIFSFVATYLETQKVVTGWIYWIAINAFSTWLYYQRDLKIYAALMVVYTVLSVVGFVSWRKEYRTYSLAEE